MAAFSWRRYFREQWCTLPWPQAVDDVSSKTFLVTGSNTGLGFEASVHLMTIRPKILIATSRDQAKCKEARRSILERVAASGIKSELYAWPLELGSFKSVRSFADRLAADGNGTLNAFVANAGVLSDGNYARTQDGWEVTLQVNYLSNALLSILLLPYLINSSSPDSPSRLVLVSSFVHYFASKLKRMDSWSNILKTINKPEFGDGNERYQASKLLLMMFVQELVARLPETTSLITCIVDPGFCESNIIRNQPHQWVFSTFKRLFLVRSTEEGSRTLVHAAVASDRSMHGRYLSSCQVAEESDFFFTPEGKSCSTVVWDETIALLSSIDGRVSEIVGKFLNLGVNS